IAGLGILGLVAALAMAQTSTSQFLRSTFRGVNSQPSSFISSGQAVTFTGAASQTAATGFFSPSTSALPIINGFSNPFTGVTEQSTLAQTISITANGTNVGGSSTGASGAIGVPLSGTIVSGTTGSALGISSAGSNGGGFTVLPSISSVSSGGNSLLGGANSLGVGTVINDIIGANSAKGSFCGGHGI